MPNADAKFVGNDFYNQVVNAFMSSIPIDDCMRSEMDALIQACVISALVDDDYYHPEAVIALMEHAATDYGCWLDDVRRAIANADLSKLFERQEAIEVRAAVQTTFRMACIWLGQIYWAHSRPRRRHS